MDRATAPTSTQLTFGTHDEGGAQFLDAEHAGVHVDGDQSGQADRSRRREERADPQRLDARPEDQRAEAVHRRARRQLTRRWCCATRRSTALAFVTYYKGEYGLHVLERKEAITKAASADFGAPGPIVDFQAPMTHTLVAGQQEEEGQVREAVPRRPPAGRPRRHQRRRLLRRHADLVHRRARRSAVQPVRVVGLAVPHHVVHLAEHGEALAVGPAGLQQTQFFYGQLEGLFYDPAFSGFIDRDLAIATRTMRGGTAFGIYPFNRYRRVELFGGFNRYQERFDDPLLERVLGRLPAGAVRPAAVQQRQHGAARRRVRAGDDDLPRVRAAGGQHDAAVVRDRAEDRQHAVAADPRRRRAQVLPPRRHRPARAARPRLQELGRQPRLHLLRRQLRAARLRLPVVRRPERVLRQRRAALPADRGDGDADRHPRRHPRHAVRRHRRRALRGQLAPITNLPFKAWRQRRGTGPADHRFRRQRPAGSRPARGRSTASAWSTAARSYGISLQTFALGFPVHFDWSWRTLFNKDWEDVVFASRRGRQRSEFRKPKFTMWIGYDW